MHERAQHGVCDCELCEQGTGDRRRAVPERQMSAIVVCAEPHPSGIPQKCPREAAAETDGAERGVHCGERRRAQRSSMCLGWPSVPVDVVAVCRSEGVWSCRRDTRPDIYAGVGTLSCRAPPAHIRPRPNLGARRSPGRPRVLSPPLAPPPPSRASCLKRRR